MKTNHYYMYLLIVLIPTILFTSIFFVYRYETELMKVKKNAEWVASIHKKQMDTFIGETITSLEVLALTLESNFSRIQDLKTTLLKTSSKDPRYGGLYLLDHTGQFVTGTDEQLKQFRLTDKEYFHAMNATNSTIVSDHQELTSNNQDVIAVVTPVFKNQEIAGILTAHLRIDYIANIMKILTPNINMNFEGPSGAAIVQLDSGKSKSNDSFWIRKSLERVPWTIAVEADNSTILKKIAPSILLFTVIFTAFLHIIFLMLQTFSLKKQAEREKAYNEVQKLELVGMLAAGTAHEIRNPLTGIQGLVQLLAEKYHDEKDQFYFSVINKEISRINQIASEFLILGKPTAKQLSKVNIKEMIEELHPFLLSEANLHHIQFYCNLEDEDVFIAGFKDEMKQVILNIAKNSFDAMKSGGSLTISLVKENSTAILTINDTGEGIAKEDLDKIFQPFFTSKEDGTGLGLVVCQRIIQSIGGIIDIESSAGTGTSVHIKLKIIAA